MKTKKRKKLTTNRDGTSAAVRSSGHESITFNLDTSVRIRHEILEGRPYTVVPMVMLTEGVHAGSNGPLYYPGDELTRTPECWDHKPVVVYHPTMNGEAVSACSPTVISRRKVGLIMNTRYIRGKAGKPGKLRAEAWLQMNRLKQVDERVYNAIKNKDMVEISTGLFTDNEQTDGTFGKKTYEQIARNYRPDHLAILPDEIGACSIKDGAGLMRNSKSSHSDIRDGIQTAVRASLKDPARPGMSDPYAYVEDVFDDFCVYSMDNKKFSVNYTVDKNGIVKLKGSPQEVVSKRTYQTKDGTVLNTRQQGATMPKLSRKQVIKNLIVNVKSPWDETDRDYLKEVDEDIFDKLAHNAGFVKEANGQDYIDSKSDNNDQVCTGEDDVKPKKMGSKSGAAKNQAEDDVDDEDDEDDEDDVTDKVKPKKTKKEKSKDEDDADDSGSETGRKSVLNSATTMEDFIDEAPEEFRDTLVTMHRQHVASRQKLISKIISNKANRFTKNQLNRKPLGELEAIVSLAEAGTARARRNDDSPTVNDYSGMGEVGGGEDGEEQEAEEPLGLPTLNLSLRGRKDKGEVEEEDGVLAFDNEE